MKMDNVVYFFFVVGLVVGFVIWIGIVNIESYDMNGLSLEYGSQEEEQENIEGLGFYFFLKVSDLLDLQRIN